MAATLFAARCPPRPQTHLSTFCSCIPLASSGGASYHLARASATAAIAVLQCTTFCNAARTINMPLYRNRRRGGMAFSRLRSLARWRGLPRTRRSTRFGRATATPYDGALRRRSAGVKITAILRGTHFASNAHGAVSITAALAFHRRTAAISRAISLSPNAALAFITSAAAAAPSLLPPPLRVASYGISLDRCGWRQRRKAGRGAHRHSVRAWHIPYILRHQPPARGTHRQRHLFSSTYHLAFSR